LELLSHLWRAGEADVTPRITPNAVSSALERLFKKGLRHAPRSLLSLKFFGEDLRELRRLAERAEPIVEGLPGLVDVNVEQVVPELLIRVDAERASTYGSSAGQAAEAVRRGGRPHLRAGPPRRK
jgi:multidrug efflux pump subunit AcrB